MSITLPVLVFYNLLSVKFQNVLVVLLHFI